METYEVKKEKVISQYFKQYLDQIYPALDLLNTLVPQYIDGTLCTAQSMFLFSVIDHFGKVLRVGKLGTAVPLGQGQNAHNFKFFIEEYFPVSDRCKGDIIYKIFRNGIMHQFVAKGSGVFWSDDPRYNQLFAERDNIPQMNNRIFSSYVKSALANVMSGIEQDLERASIENIYQHLILTHYGFDDHQILDGIITEYANRGKTIYDPC